MKLLSASLRRPRSLLDRLLRRPRLFFERLLGSRGDQTRLVRDYFGISESDLPHTWPERIRRTIEDALDFGSELAELDRVAVRFFTSDFLETDFNKNVVDHDDGKYLS